MGNSKLCEVQMANPWMKFYPQDWRADERLRMCDLAARGLWMEMLAIMHRSDKYGFLLVAGKAPTEAQLSVQVGATPQEVVRLIDQLRTADVFSCTANGVIYSRRMVRDHKKSKAMAKNGKKGGDASLGKQKGKVDLLEQKSSKGLSLRSQRPDTDTNVSGVPPNLKDQLFGGCLQFIVSCGKSEKHSRSLIGKWRKAMGDAETVTLISHCQANSISDPVAYIEKAKAARGGNHNEYMNRKYGT